MKQLATAALGSLSGLQSMNPASDFLSTLPVLPAHVQCYALTSDYEALPGDVAMKVVDEIVDAAMKPHGNDLAVPTEGVFTFGSNGSGFGPSPLSRCHRFGPSDSVPHTAFFGRTETQRMLRTWL